MNFIRNIISKLFSLVFYFGLLLVAFGLMEMFDNRKLSSEPEAVNIENLFTLNDGKRKYVAVSGGKLDLEKTTRNYLTSGGTDTGINTSFYTPVYDENDTLVFLFETDDIETLAKAAEMESLSGLLHDSEMTEHIQFKMEEVFEEEGYFVVDNSYEAATVMEQIMGMKNSIFIALFGLIGLILFRDRRKKEGEQEEEVIKE